MAQAAPQAVPKTPTWSISLDPKKYVNSAAISGDATKVVAGTFYHAYKPTNPLAMTLPAPPGPDQFGTYCFNGDGKQLWVDQFTGWEGVYAVAISDDGTVAASGGWYSHNPLRGFIRAYAAIDGKLLLNNLIGARVNQLALSANGPRWWQRLTIYTFSNEQMVCFRKLRLSSSFRGQKTLCSQLQFQEMVAP